jgi:hypothetical protein
MTARRKWLAVAALGGLFGFRAPGYAIDSATLEYGSGNRTQVVRAGVQWRWDRQWWRSNGTHLGGTQHLTDIGITPVFRFQKDSLRGPYAEAGIGLHYLSGLYDNNGRRLSTRFQFGDHLGIGYVFDNKLDIALKLQHVSNGGIKEPNNGVNFLMIRIGYQF